MPGMSRQSEATVAVVGPTDDWSLWGKHRGLGGHTYPLVCHLLDTGQAALIVFDAVLSEPQRVTVAAALTGADLPRARALVALLAGWHDIGKACPAFQALVPEAYEKTGASPWRQGLASFPRHDLTGYYQFVEWMRDQANLGEVASMVGQIIGGHHGRYSPTFRARDLVPADASIALHGEGRAGAWRGRRDSIMKTVAELLLPDTDWRELVPALNQVERTTETPVAICLATAVVIVADWVVSDTRTFLAPEDVPARWDDDAVHRWMTIQQQRVADQIHASGVIGPPLTSRPITEQFPSVGIVEPRGVQRFATGELAGLGPGLVVLMAPTGEGKTEAGLHAASVLSGHHNGPGFLLALPTMATTNALFDRCVAFCRHAFDDSTRITLMHSMAYSVDSYTQLTTAEATPTVLVSHADDGGDNPLVEVTDWLRGYKRGLVSPNTVCTIDQILTVAIASKWMPLPLTGLTRKVVVIDEVHAYDPHMQALLGRLLTWLAACSTSVVAMSATLSQQSAQALVKAYRSGLGLEVSASGASVPRVSYPGWVHVSQRTGEVTQGESPTTRTRTPFVELETYPQEHGHMDHTRLAATIAAILAPILDDGDGNALVICNTVQAAVDVYTSLRQVAGSNRDDLPLELFHARFPNAQRVVKANRLTSLYGRDDAERPARSILVATQVAEQSLDIDLDIVVSELAPAAQLLQREGRGHRHPRPGRPAPFTEPRLVVVAEVDAQGSLRDKDQRPYDHIDLANTWNELKARAQGAARLQLAIPGEVQELMNAVYDLPGWQAAPELIGHRSAADARSRVAVGAARQKMIPAPAAVTDLTRLTTQEDVDLADYSARYDIDSLPLLPVWLDPNGALRMRGPTGPLVPVGPHITHAEVRAVTDQTINVSPSRRWRKDLLATSERLTPTAWQEHTNLKHIAVAVMDAGTVGPGGHRYTALIGPVRLQLHPDTGLTIHHRDEGNTT
jgi:CRISPR-associated endonuclease/helicase Cas3